MVVQIEWIFLSSLNHGMWRVIPEPVDALDASTSGVVGMDAGGNLHTDRLQSAKGYDL